MDAFIDEILEWGDWETFVYQPPARPQQHPSETITVREKSSSSSTQPLATTLGRLLQRDFSTAIQQALREAIQSALVEEDNFET